MRRRYKILACLIPLCVATGIGGYCSHRAAGPALPLTTRPGPDAVEVTKLDEPIRDNAERFLWDHFANMPQAEQFSRYTADGWRADFKAFAESLTAKAREANLQADSLAGSLDLIFKHAGDGTAYLPVGAYQTTFKDRSVWIVTVKWGYTESKGAGLGHIRMFVYDQKTLELVAYCTCM